jgi:hypothetical protein
MEKAKGIKHVMQIKWERGRSVKKRNFGETEVDGEAWFLDHLRE